MINLNILAAKDMLAEELDAEIRVPLQGNVLIHTKSVQYSVIGERKTVLEALDS